MPPGRYAIRSRDGHRQHQQHTFILAYALICGSGTR
jgi:hypothetical protein